MEYIGYITELLRCAITGEVPKVDIKEIDPAMLYQIADRHKIANILYTPLSKTEVDMNTESWSRFQTSNEIGVMLSFQQEYYLEEVSRLLCEHKIKFMPLKGSIIKYLYPTPDMRQSSDIDILFDEDKADEVKSLLEGIGFTNTLYGRDQDVYENGNVCIEMHRSLLPDKSPWFDKVKDIIKRANTKDGYHYEMTKEDFYLFDIIHIAKHVSGGGIGIRAVLDIWVYMRAYSSELDMEEINARLAEFGLAEFEANIRGLSEYWFCEGAKNNKIELLEQYIVQSGWTGTMEQKLALTSKEHVKDNRFLYLMNYIFKPAKEMQGTYKYLRKYPFLAPLAWTDRIFKAVFVRKGAVNSFWHRYDDIDAESIDSLKGLMKEIGL